VSKVIQVENLGKRYVISHARARTASVREAIVRGIRQAGKRLLAPNRVASKEEFWALRNVDLQVAQGERVGIIGRNGAGKSTLLKILSRITDPTEGRVSMKGRTASLLEVGTGFHPELTGRENIFLNGAILGMPRVEIKRKFDEIVAFAEVDRFIDTPVKRYSSGMYVRLAFAVAAHLEPEILIVDEVLAVGDAQFQKKCLGKMETVSRREGRTVLLVSHQMQAIQALCTRVLFLEAGRIAYMGTPEEAVSRYISTPGGATQDSVIDLREAPRSAGRERVIISAWVENSRGEPVSSVLMGSSLRICYSYKHTILRNPAFGFGVENAYGQRLFSLNNHLSPGGDVSSTGHEVAVFEIAELQLLPGSYYVSLSVVEDGQTWIDYVERAFSFSVVAADVFGTGRMLESSQGIVYARGRVYTREHTP
jgi:lipopolysaccharide transport system ATP-binding protein